MPTDILVMVESSEARLGSLRSLGEVHYAPGATERAAVIAAHGPKIRALVTNGSIGVQAAEIELLPALGIIIAVGAGFENIDLAAARARGIAVAHGPGTNDAAVADHAFALLLGVARDLLHSDRQVREGLWDASRRMRPGVAGKRLGILGLGRIGLGVARRGEGFGMEIGYHNRHRRDDVPYRYHASLRDLAEASDFLVAVAPGGPETRHIVDAEVLRALGPKGFLVNVGRGSVVDNAALAAALHGGTIAGAGLDVLDGEPNVPAELLSAPNLLFTPHVAGRSPDAVAAGLRLLMSNLAAFFEGRPLVTPVP
ncbi:2-hydroxyacid dehydrogenase [Roseomonas elaeocarpi]|uniref:2-hydroxyacid dehydrogenase n=1 Tax=Roseomonas elaeocarpi TaxID=907779 RepID=A0ABV6JZK8_9PROT